MAAPGGARCGKYLAAQHGPDTGFDEGNAFPQH